MIRRELNCRHWYGAKLRGSRRHKQFILDGMICLGEYYIDRPFEGPLPGSNIPWGLESDSCHCERTVCK